jgi:hypothetical protein
LALETLLITLSTEQLETLSEKLDQLRKVPYNLQIAMNVLEIERDALRLVEQIERDIATIQESAEKAQLEISVL